MLMVHQLLLLLLLKKKWCSHIQIERGNPYKGEGQAGDQHQ
jgi:hypothetical protein